MLGIESIALDPTNPNRVYIAAGTYTNNWAGNGAILRSNDRGRIWARTNLPFKNGGNEDGRSIGERLVVNPRQPNVLFFGTRRSGLWKSVDAGATWAKLPGWPAPENANGIGVAFVIFGPDNALYAGVADKGANLFRSRDEGATWQEVQGGPCGLLPHHGAFDASGTLFLTYGNGPGPNGMSDGAVWKLDTRTSTWSDITPQKPNQNGAGGFGYAGLALDAQKPGTLMVATMDRWNPGDDIFRSNDGGATWSGLKARATRDSSLAPFLNWGGKEAAFGHWIGSVAIDPFNSNHALYGTGATMWGTDDLLASDKGQGTQWTPRTQGLEETAVLALASPPSGAHLLSALGDIGVFRHDDLNTSPRAGMATNPTFSTATGLDFAELAPHIVLRSGHANNGARNGAFSLDGGQTWAPFASEPAGAGNARPAAGSVAASADGAAFLWTPERMGSFVTRDRGATWTACNGLPQGLDVVADRAQPNAFYAFDRQNGTLLASTDGGLNFAARATNLPRSGGRLAAVPGRASDLWLALGDGGLHQSINGGARFLQAASVQNAEAVGFGRAAPGSAYPTLFLSGRVGDVWGIFRSLDGGLSGARINDEAHKYGITPKSITGDPRVFGRVYFGTNGRGILVGEPAAP